MGINWQIAGLPAHPLLVHLTVVAVPLACILALVIAFWPRARRWFSWGTPVVALIAGISVPLATQSGGWLEGRVQMTPVVQKHVDEAHNLLPWMGLLMLAMLAWWAWHAFVTPRANSAGLLRTVAIAGPIVLTVLAFGTLAWVVLIGHAGAAAAWQGRG